MLWALGLHDSERDYFLANLAGSRKKKETLREANYFFCHLLYFRYEFKSDFGKKLQVAQE